MTYRAEYMIMSCVLLEKEAIVSMVRSNCTPPQQAVSHMCIYLFPSRDPDAHEFSLRQFLNRQQHILHGFEGKKLKYIPKVGSI